MAWSSWSVSGAALAFGIAAHGCKGDNPALTDACSKTAAAVASSLKAWQQLRRGGTTAYWYEEENCAPNQIQGQVNTIQVDSNGTHIVSMQEIDPSDCQAQVNRYESFEAQTFEELYAACKMLVARECDAHVETDEQGVLRSCTWDADDECEDNCGEGFHLRRWGFGDAPE